MKIFTITLSLLCCLQLTSQGSVTIQGTNMDSSHLVIERGNLTINGQVNANNGLILSSTSSIDRPGSIKFENGEFLGYDGNRWVSLSRPLEKEILGFSIAATDGSIQKSVDGFLVNGLEAANAICRADFPDEPTAHFYHIDEIEKAVALGNLGSSDLLNTEFWTMASVFRVSGSTFFQTNTSVNNCFNFLSSGGNSTERGSTVRITYAAPYSGQLVGYQVNLAFGATCNEVHRIICGK